jgi:hypothetical protein
MDERPDVRGLGVKQLLIRKLKSMLQKKSNDPNAAGKANEKPFFAPAPQNQQSNGQLEEIGKAMNIDTDAIQLHTDGRNLPSGKSAMAKGNEISIDSSISKGSDTFNYLLAHEMAHVAQQREGAQSAALASSESEAATVGMAYASGKKTGFWQQFSIRNAISKTAAHYSTCFGFEEPPARIPDYMGEHSRAAIREIEGVIGSSDALSVIILVGTVGLAATESPLESAAKGGPGDEITAAAGALRAVPTIRDARITQIIQFLLLEHENDMNQQERQFWNRALENLDLIRTR